MSILSVKVLNILPAVSILFFPFEAGADDELFMDSVLQSRVCRADMPIYTDLRYKDYCQDALEPHADLWEIDRCQRRINQINSKIYQYNSFIRLCGLKHPAARTAALRETVLRRDRPTKGPLLVQRTMTDCPIPIAIAVCQGDYLKRGKRTN